MKPQSGARTDLIDPFGRELEEWLRDAPAVRRPYVGDLVVPPTTRPVATPKTSTAAEDSEAAEEPRAAEDSSPAVVSAGQSAAFRRERGRHTRGCLPSFPEPPERLALRFDALAVEVSASSGRSVIERIVFFENELQVREDDIARLKAWEDEVSSEQGPEVEAAREYAREVFADILVEAAAEQERRDRDAARASRRAAAVSGAHHTDAPVGPAPLVQPATGPTVLDHAAVTEAIRANTGPTATVPDTQAADSESNAEAVVTEAADEPVTEHDEQPADVRHGWWARIVAAVRRVFAGH